MKLPRQLPEGGCGRGVRLDCRLQWVSDQVRAISTSMATTNGTHADIGSDHGYLLLHLLAQGIVQRGIAIENNKMPFERSRRTLSGLPVDIRLGDGLAALQPGEADSLSICGMGGRTIDEIVSRYPERLPTHVILQPNRDVRLVRHWALHNGFHLISEHITERLDVITCFEYQFGTMDPAYRGIDLEVALEFGPILLSRNEPILLERLRSEREYFSNLPALTQASRNRLRLIDRALQRG